MYVLKDKKIKVKKLKNILSRSTQKAKAKKNIYVFVNVYLV